MRLEREGQAVRLPPLALLLLTYLRLQQRPIGRDDICRLFWPDLPRPRARHALSQQLYSIRRELKDVVSETAGGAIQVAATGLACDIAALLEADHRSATQSLYTGAFLGAYAHTLPFELARWVEEKDGAARSIAADALRTYREDAEREHRWGDLEKTCRAALDIGTPDPATYMSLYRALQALSRPSEAATVLNEATELYGEDWLGSTNFGSAEADTTEALRFVGRAAEFQRLRSAWDSSVAGAGQFVLVTGDAGIGKTRLAYQLQRLCVLQGAVVLHMRCYEATRRIPYSPVVEVARRLADLCSEHLPEWATKGLLSLVATTESADRTSAMPHTASPYILQSVDKALAVLCSRTPVLLVADDLQWLDGATAELMHLLASRVGSRRLLLLCCCRAGTQTTTEQHRLERAAHHHLCLKDMSFEDSQALVKEYFRVAECQHIGDEHKIIKFAAGNPFFLLELLHAATKPGVMQLLGSPDEGLPPSVQRLITDKWLHLSRSAMELARACAVLDSAATPEVLRRVAGIPSNQMLRATEELVAESFLAGTEAPVLRLRHDLLREGIYGAIPTKVRVVLHCRAAYALRARGVRPATVAEHAMRGGVAKLAWRSAIDAGDQALRVAASAEALHWYRRAHDLAVPERARMLAAERILHLAVSDGVPVQEATPFVSQLREWYTARADAVGRLRCEYIELCGSTAGGAHSSRERFQRFSALSRDAREIDDSIVEMEAAREAFASAQHAVARNEVATLIRGKLADLGTYSPEARVAMRAFGAVALVVCGTWVEAIAAAELAAEEAARMGHTPSQIIGRGARACAYAAAARLREAEVDYLWAIAECESSGFVGPLARTQLNYGVLLLDKGDYTKADEVFRVAAAGLDPRRAAFALINAALCSYEEANFGKASDLIDQCLAAARSSGVQWVATTGVALRGLIALEVREIATANECWRDLQGSLEEHLESISDPVPVAAFAARMLASQGRADDALRLLQRTIDECAQRNAVVAARLQLHAAELQIQSAPDCAYRIARDIQRAAQTWEAKALAQRAAWLLEKLI